MLTIRANKGTKVISTQDFVADCLGVTPTQIKRLLDQKLLVESDKKDGIDLMPSVRAYIERMRAKESAPDSGGISAAEARRLKTLKEVEKLELQISQQKGELIAIDAVREKATRAGALLIAELASMANDAPGMLAGADEATIRERMESRHVTLVQRFREALAECEALVI